MSLDERARRKLVREATKTPTATLKQLQGFMTQISQILHKLGFVWEGCKRKATCSHDLALRPLIPRPHGERCCGQMRLKFNYLASTLKNMYGRNPIQLTIQITPFLQ